MDDDLFLGLLLNVLDVDGVIDNDVVDDGHIAEWPSVSQITPVLADDLI
jgi:hypothetical protein